MPQTYLTTDELSARIKYDTRTIRERLKAFVSAHSDFPDPVLERRCQLRSTTAEPYEPELNSVYAAVLAHYGVVADQRQWRATLCAWPDGRTPPLPVFQRVAPDVPLTRPRRELLAACSPGANLLLPPISVRCSLRQFHDFSP
ncbi:MAG: hypothetical protein Q8K23_21140 [Sulfuritalea sp.]|nr:hypothetical protein [Sulfuritalea sp.]